MARPPIEYYLQQSNAAPARPFSTPTKPEDDPGILGGFVGSMFSAVPELFGAQPTQAAEQYRATHPVGGFISELPAFTVPWMGAERVAQLPSMAPRLAEGVDFLLGKLGKNTVENPIAAGITRELIVNAPVEASRLAVGSTLYPDNHDLWTDVAINYALTGGIGGLGGIFRLRPKSTEKLGAVAGAEFSMSPTHQLKMVLDDGAEVANVPKAEFIPQLRQQVLTETPGVGGASKKELPYVLPLQGLNADEQAATNALFQPGRMKAEGEDAPLTGMVKQRLDEGRGPNQLKVGEQQVILDQLPETFTSIDDIAKNIQYPRRVILADKDGARSFAGLTSNPSWQPVSDRLSLLQERDGAFVFKYKLADGKGQAVGKGAGKAKVGEQYLIGKTLNPGLFDPKAAKLADLVTAKWAKMSAAFQPGRFDDVFNQHNDLMMRAMSTMDYNNLGKLPEAEWKLGMKKKLGQLLAGEEGVLDSKLGLKDSETISSLVDQAYLHFKPTEFLQRQNPVYGRFFGLMRNSYRVADRYASQIMRGQMKLKPGTTLSQAMRNKGVKYEPGFEGHDAISDIIFNQMHPSEVNLMAHLSGTNKLSDEGLTKLVADGDLTERGAESIKKLRAINEDVINKLVMPVFKDTESGASIKWIENHLGIPHVTRGDLFYEVVDSESGKVKHLAFGKNGAQAMREAKIVQETAKDAGKNWTIKKAEPRHVAAESSDVLESLGRQVFTNIQQTAEEGEVIYRAMRRLSAVKSTSGRNPAIPVSSGMFKERSGISNSYKMQEFKPIDVVNNMEAHLKQLLHFAALQSYKERFGSVAAHMLENDKPLLNDLNRKANQMLGIEGRLTNWMNETLAPVLGSPKAATKIAAGVNQYIAAANLFWLNPTFAVLNLLTPLQTVAPWIAHMRIANAADLAKTTYMQLHPAYDRLGNANGIAAFTDPMKILGQAVKLMREPTPELKTMFEQADSDGVFHPQIFEEWLGRHSRASQSLSGAFKEDGVTGFLKQMATWGSDQSEKFSRLTAFNSGYIVGKEYFGLEGDALYNFARRAVEITQFNYSTIDRSRIFTGPVGSMFGLFKNWQMHFLGNMLGYAGVMKNNAANPAAWAPLTWTVGSALALGGLGATPLAAIADGLGSWNETDKNSFLWTQNHFKEPVGLGDTTVGDAMYFGLPAFLGVSLQASSAIPGTDVQNETASLFSFAAWQRGKQLGEALGEIVSNEFQTGSSGLDQQNLRDKLFSATMPRFATKLYSAVEGDYVRSMSTGAPQVRDVSPAGKMLTMAGFNPVEVAQWQEASKRSYKSREARQSLVQSLGRAHADAYLNGDKLEQERIIQRGIITGTLDSVLASSASHQARENQGDILSRYKKGDANLYRNALEPQPPNP